MANNHRRASPLITREAIQERLSRRRSEEGLTASRSASASPLSHLALAEDGDETPMHAPAEEDGADTDANVSRVTEPDEELAQRLHPMVRGQNPTHDGVMSVDPEPQPIDPPRPSPTAIQRAHTIDTVDSAPSIQDVKMDAKRAFAGLELDFEHGFGLGEEGMSVSAGLGVGIAARAKRHSRSESLHGGVHLGDVSALDRLMEDIGQGAGVDASANTSITAGTETSVLSAAESEAGEPHGHSFGSLKVETVTEGVKAAAFSLPDIVRDDGGISMDMGLDLGFQPSPRSRPQSAVPIFLPSASSASPSPPPPPPPAKDARRAREELILSKKRELRRAEYEDDSEMGSPAPEVYVSPRPASMHAAAGRSTPAQAPAHRRVKSSVDDGMLDVSPMRDEDAPLAATINRELKKREGGAKRAVSPLDLSPSPIVR